MAGPVESRFGRFIHAFGALKTSQVSVQETQAKLEQAKEKRDASAATAAAAKARLEAAQAELAALKQSQVESNIRRQEAENGIKELAVEDPELIAQLQKTPMTIEERQEKLATDKAEFAAIQEKLAQLKALKAQRDALRAQQAQVTANIAHPILAPSN